MEIPEIGFYSPWSWWPIVSGRQAQLWPSWASLWGTGCLSMPLPFVLIGIVGWTYEYYRGYFAR